MINAPNPRHHVAQASKSPLTRLEIHRTLTQSSITSNNHPRVYDLLYLASAFVGSSINALPPDH
jgi:hypothetical protein